MNHDDVDDEFTCNMRRWFELKYKPDLASKARASSSICEIYSLQINIIGGNREMVCFYLGSNNTFEHNAVYSRL